MNIEKKGEICQSHSYRSKLQVKTTSKYKESFEITYLDLNLVFNNVTAHF